MNGGMMRWLLSGLVLLFGLALVLSFGGRYHGAGDALAVARPWVAVVLGGGALGLLVIGPRRLGVVGIALALVGAISLRPPALASEVSSGSQVYALYQKNLLFRLADAAPVAEDILASVADFVTLQELHSRNRSILGALRQAYPHQQLCPFAAVGGVAVLSRWPATDVAPLCGEGNGWAAMQVETPDGPMWVLSVHLHWPFPYGQSAQLQRILPALGSLNGPAVVGGDFNMVPWSYAVAAVGRATGTQSAGLVGGTFAFSYHREGRNLAAWMPLLPIDHVLVPVEGGPISLEKRPQLGSDHHGLLVGFVLGR